MNILPKAVAFIILASLLSGCATHMSPLQAKDGEKFLFATDNEEAIFQAAYDAMLEGRKESPIKDITGPIRGFVLTRKWALDYWTSMIRVYPAKGVTLNGEQVTGYYPEVSGEGTLIIRGPSMDARIYKVALDKFAQVGKRQVVSKIERGEYLLERDGWRLNSKAPLRDGGTIKIEGLNKSESSKTAEERLQNIQALKAKGIITEQEYKDARHKILDDL